MKKHLSFSSGKTKILGDNFSKKILKAHIRKRGATVVAMRGELGSGKTTFTQGFLYGLGVRKRTASPTFILMRKFKIVGNHPFKNFYHIDAYRIKDAKETSHLGLGDIFSDNKNIVLIEWADKIKNILPRDSIWVKFLHGKKEDERAVYF